MSASFAVPASSLCVDLDCLLDTRMATLYTFGEAAVEANLSAGYFGRIADVFTSVDPVAYTERYQTRGRAILKNGIATGILRLVAEFVQEISVLQHKTPFHTTPKVFVNTYPYVLTEKEAQCVVLGLVAATRRLASIELVHLSPEALTVAWVKQTLAVLILYNYPAWLTAQHANGQFAKASCPDVTLFGPALYFTTPPPTTEPLENVLAPFTAMEEHVAPLIGLKLLPIGVYSLAASANATLFTDPLR